MNKCGIDVQMMIREYASGKSVKEVAKIFEVSIGKTYYMLRDAGCVFRKRGFPSGYVMSIESVEKSAKSRRGIKRSEETRQKISESRKKHYNGLNGFGHVKEHNMGYVLAYAPEHPNAHADGYVMLHTILIERSLGRYLKKNEVVHHKNRDKKDNRIENLELMDKREHMSMHLKERHKKRRNDLLTVYT